jgi:hypothetical protein
MHVH